ncbi:hypothetical protein [Nocardia sp. NPDC004722]
MTGTGTRPGYRRAARLGRVVAAVAALVGLPLFGMYRCQQWQDVPVESVRIARQVRVAGFEPVAVVSWSPGDDLPEAMAYFAGPQPYPDPVAAVSVPTIALQAADRVTMGSSTETRTASGSRPDRCAATVYFNPDPWTHTVDKQDVRAKLSEARSAGKILILVEIRGCGV